MELKGSKTEKNLETAFTRESKVYNEYLYFTSVAKKEGFNQITEAFAEAAVNERAHAKRELDFLKGSVNTETNLKAAIEGENYENTEMYPEFEKTAREEGFTEIADFFKRLTAIEKEHEKTYRAMLEELQESKESYKEEKAVWKCGNCGWIDNTLEHPEDCPTCKMPLRAYDNWFQYYPFSLRH